MVLLGCSLCRVLTWLVNYFVFVILMLFFFFKQKTAYEMRISDWSSDGCSSDLPTTGADAPHCQPASAVHFASPDAFSTTASTKAIVRSPSAIPGNQSAAPRGGGVAAPVRSVRPKLRQRFANAPI